MNVLITGATGFIGSALVHYLLTKNDTIHFLTTDVEDIAKHSHNVKGFLWNPSKNEIDINCFKDIDAIVNLAGHTINCKWTSDNRQKIYQSRIDCSNTLFNALQTIKHTVKHIIHASAIGIYPSSETTIYSENTPIYGNDFLANVCKDWEKANLRFETLGIKTAITRFGLILSKEHGVLHELAKIVSLGLGANLGNGRQWMSWIHVNDVIQILAWLLSKESDGFYNVVAPNPVQQNTFLKLLAQQLNKPLWLPSIPEFFIKTALGERSALVLSSQKVQSMKLQQDNYIFSYSYLTGALNDLYK